MKRNSKKIMIIALLLALVVCLYFVAGTYAKYVSEATASSTINIAQWKVLLGNTDISDGTTTDFSTELALETESSSTVKAGTIAPGTTASGSFNIDATATEVAVNYTITIGTISYGGTTKPNIEVTSVTANGTALSGGSGVYTGSIALTDIGTPVTIKVTATWTSNGDTEDTTIGATAGTVTVPVTVTVEQAV